MHETAITECTRSRQPQADIGETVWANLMDLAERRDARESKLRPGSVVTCTAPADETPYTYTRFDVNLNGEFLGQAKRCKGSAHRTDGEWILNPSVLLSADLTDHFESIANRLEGVSDAAEAQAIVTDAITYG